MELQPKIVEMTNRKTGDVVKKWICIDTLAAREITGRDTIANEYLTITVCFYEESEREAFRQWLIANGADESKIELVTLDKSPHIRYRRLKNWLPDRYGCNDCEFVAVE